MSNCSFRIKTRYCEEDYEYAVRDNSLEYNHYSSCYNIVKLYTGRGVFVASSSNKDFEELGYIINNLGSTSILDHREIRVYCDEFYSGKYHVGREAREEYIVELLKHIRRELVDRGLNVEVILVSRHYMVKHSVDEYSVEAYEDRWIHELYVYTYKLFMGRLLSSGVVYASNDVKGLLDIVDILVDKVYGKTIIHARTKRFNPIHTGRWNTILIGDTAAAFYHEITHLLEADEPVKLPLNHYLGVDLTIIEDPFYNGPLQRVFDDELYPAWRRILIEKGVVTDYLRTRTSSNGSKPGNARGLFIKPRSFYHQLIVKPGDWSFKEALDELRRVVVVEDLLEARLHSGVIEILPELAYIYDKKYDRLQPVRQLRVSIPLDKLDKIITGLTRNLEHRYSYEKNMPIYEVFPQVILESNISTI